MSLDTCPLELTNLIISHLNKADLCVLRLSCRALHAKLQTTFAACLQRFTVFSTRESLDRLEAAASPVFSALLEAISASSATIRELSTCAENERCCGILPEQLTLSQENYDALLPGLHKLETLHLCIQYTDSAALRRLQVLLTSTATGLKILSCLNGAR
jgi:hypothetical protein